MAATPTVARESTPTEVRRRLPKAGTPGSARGAAEERPPVNKKVKMSATAISRGDESGPLFVGESRGSVAVPVITSGKGKATQTTTQQNVGYLDPSNLQNLRETISQQFDIEILLKHRELGLIEQEIAKTQICIEQLRRCTLKPYQSPEISLENYTPESKDNGIPDYAPPHWSVVDGPYTRHYKQWLLPDPRFDGYGPEGPPPVYHAGKTTRSQKGLEPTQTYTVSGRPQRQSVIKVQQRGGTGTQQCIFRRSDGATVRLECLDCKRSDFSSAQGFINHCRIAHQREYASHEAAAFACGQTVEETDEGFISPYPRGPVDPPSRNTRQTQQQILTPQNSFSSTSRGSISGPSGALAAPTPRPTPLPKNKSAPNTMATQRKNGRVSSRAAMTTPRREASENGSRRPPTPPQDGAVYRTPHLEGLLKRKKIEIDLTKVVKEVRGEKINWDMETWSASESSSDESEEGLKDKDGDVAMSGVEKVGGKDKGKESARVGNQNHVAAVRQENAGLGVPAVTSGRSVSRMSPAPSAAPPPPTSRAGAQTEEPNKVAAAKKQASMMVDEQDSSMEDSQRLSFNIGMDGSYDYDASSSDDEDGYKSDADAHEDVEMEVESATSHSSEEDQVPTTDTTSFKQHTPLPSQMMGSLIPHPTVHQPASATPISPALSVSTEDVEREMGTPARPQIDQTPAMLTPISPAATSLSKQVRFVMPTSKNGIRKLGNNPGGVLESGLAKMKFGNVRKSGMFSSGEGR